jgi:hypothetical protein
VTNLENTTEELNEKIDELTFWLKFSVWSVFLKTLRATLPNEIDRLVYELSDNRSTREIAQILTKNGKRITHQTVANMWQRWAEVPIVMPAHKKGRFKRVVSLKLIGIQVPPIEGLPKKGDIADE